MGERPTNVTSGLSSSASLRSADLQLYLESRLQAKLAGLGSPEYALTWKHWPLESGPPICALRASGHRISGNDSTGWPTPSANQFEQNPEAWEKRRQRNLAKGYNGNGQGATLDIAAQATAGWPIPNAADSWTPPYATENTMRRGDPNGTLRSTSGSLAKDVVMKVGWPTPTPMARDGKGGFQGGRIRKGKISTDSLDVTAQLAPGQTPSPSPASTAKSGVLNPEFVRWLMGFPEEWGNYAPTAMPSSRKSQRNS
tara:strand:- start:417 stop:1181 length:765 start_codon:yes stop_codon:yes gene_type:complete